MARNTRINPHCYPERNFCEALEEPDRTKCGYLKTDGQGNVVELEVYPFWKNAETLIKEALLSEAKKQGMVK